MLFANPTKPNELPVNMHNAKDIARALEMMRIVIIVPDVDGLVAELANVHMDDLGRISERDPMQRMEPLVGFLIGKGCD